MNIELLHDDCLYDAPYRASFYPTGYFVETATDGYHKLFGKTGNLLQKEKFFDPSEGDARLRDAVLHEICHYLQFSTTSLGCLHLMLTLASAQLIIEQAGLYKIASALGKQERLPSHSLPFIKLASRTVGYDFCKRIAKTVANLWKGQEDSRSTISQVDDLKALVQTTVDVQSVEGQILGATFSALDTSGEPAETMSGALLFKSDAPPLSLFCGEPEDIETIEVGGQNYSIITTLDLLESHARLMEEYMTLIAQANNWQAHPWAVDREYRASQVIGQYGRTRHLVTKSLASHEFMHRLLDLTKNGETLDLTNRETLLLYLHMLELQLLVHDVALMVPLSAEGTKIPWTSFSPLERFNIALNALKDWTMLGAGTIREYRPWFQVADMMTNRMGGPSYSETIKRLVLILSGDLGLRLPHLREAARLRSETHPYLNVFQTLQIALTEGPGPIFFGETGAMLLTPWSDNPQTKFQWKVMIWALSTHFFDQEERSKEKLRQFAGRCTSEHARAAAGEVGLAIYSDSF